VAWTIVLAIVAAVAVYLVRRIGLWVAPRATSHPFVVLPLVGAAVVLPIFGRAHDRSMQRVP
jgi:uncharacterized membrane protein YeaQ/YmgE (transglycosylase-associated protein family)